MTEKAKDSDAENDPKPAKPRPIPDPALLARNLYDLHNWLSRRHRDPAGGASRPP